MFSATLPTMRKFVTLIIFISDSTIKAFLSSVILHFIAISVVKTKKPFADGFTDRICAQKKNIPA